MKFRIGLILVLIASAASSLLGANRNFVPDGTFTGASRSVWSAR